MLYTVSERYGAIVGWVSRVFTRFWQRYDIRFPPQIRKSTVRPDFVEVIAKVYEYMTEDEI